MIANVKRFILARVHQQGEGFASYPIGSTTFELKDSYIGVQLQGGLGNQLFQFAAGLELALLYKKRLILIDQALQIDSKRTFSLDVFGLKPNTPYVADIVGERLTLDYAELNVPNSWYEIRENHFHYACLNPQEIISNNCLLIGYFQSERYFSTVDKYLTNYLKSFLVKAESVELVAHLRRGDFLDPETRRYHGILPDSYYAGALRLFPTATKLVLVCEHIDIDKSIAVLSREFPDVEIVQFEGSQDLRKAFSLLASSNNLIIANSSFSWWAGKLSQNSNGRVVAPRSYFSQETLRVHNTCDLYPDGWILL